MLPALGDSHNLALMVAIPVAAVAQRQELGVSMVIHIAQRKIRALSKWMHMMDGIGQRRHGRDFPFAVIASDT